MSSLCKPRDYMIKKAGLFDLDNTLYDVEQFFSGAFRDISKYMSYQNGLPEERIYQALVRIWREKTSMYPKLFDNILDFFGLGKDSLQDLVKIFNEYSGTLQPYSDVVPALEALREKNFKLGIITDGNVDRQKRKIEMIGLRPFFDTVIYAQEKGTKLCASPFLAALDILGVNSSETFYIGDNPLLDFKGAKDAGLKTIRLLRGEFVQVPCNEYIDFEIIKLDELFGLVEMSWSSEKE